MANSSAEMLHAPVQIKTTHFRLLVTDYDAEYRFFRDVLGFKPTFGAEGENYADFDCNGTWVALFKRHLMSEDLKTVGLPSNIVAQDTFGLIFAVGSVDETLAKVRKNGVRVVTEPHDRPDWGVRVAHFRDPDGNLIEINQGIS